MCETTTRELTRHFFRRFFENDVVQSAEGTVTTVVRALSIVAVPGLMFAFWLQNQYIRRPPWGRIEDEYFFVMFSFVVMAGVAIFEWEMLFPDRLDFIVLTPLSLRRWQMPAAKATALAMFLGLFLVAANFFGIFMLPAVTKSSTSMLPGIAGSSFGRQIVAQAVATLSAGIFGALAVMLLSGVLLCVFPPMLFRTVSLAFRMLAVTALGLLVIHYARFGDSMQQLLANGGEKMRWVPSFWFLGLYQSIQHGAAAPSFAAPMMQRADIASALALLGVVLVYPMAWIRMRRMAIEEQVNRTASRGHLTSRPIHSLIRIPEQRAVFHFIGQTMARTTRYQVYMAIYFGAGLALAISCATRVQVQNGTTHPALSSFGLHAVMPLLVFWTIAGLKMAFVFPLQLDARWIFRSTGASLSSCIAAARKWALSSGLAVVFVVTTALVCAGWSGCQLLVQAVCGAALAAILVDGFFFAQTSVPFSRARRPGRTSLPLLLALYLGVLPPSIYGMVFLELKLERDPFLLIAPVAFVPLLHYALRRLRDRAVLVEEEREGADGEFQLLGLCGDLST
ncbi:MAG TPA: hypothetical protein VMD97_06355 [Candidatus Aquilonibacter sp.]|nr:hypothetical protein [Candidatus Aquilonibacter sp.]